MARVVVLGAGVAGHTAAMELRRKLGREHEVVVVTPNRLWNWIPSNIWVGVGLMTKKGSAGHWIKSILHTMFLYKAKARPGWWLIPE